MRPHARLRRMFLLALSAVLLSCSFGPLPHPTVANGSGLIEFYKPREGPGGVYRRFEVAELLAAGGSRDLGMGSAVAHDGKHVLNLAKRPGTYEFRIGTAGASGSEQVAVEVLAGMVTPVRIVYYNISKASRKDPVTGGKVTEIRFDIQVTLETPQPL